MSYETFEKALCTLPETAGRRFFIRHDFPLSRVTSFHIGGNADLAVYPADAEAFAYALDAVVQAGVPYTVIGNGSNTLVRDGGFRGVVFVTTDMRRVTIDGTRLTGGCGVLLGSVGTNASRAGLAGAEFANGIPGTLGGAVYMNAGAYGGQLADIVCETVCYDLDAKQVLHLDNAAQHFGYRHSVFMEKNYIILSATLQLTKDEPDAIRARMNDYLARRREKQPLEYPSAGSTFKRPKGYFAGKLIMDAGLCGFQVGGAQVSEKHCGFVINTGDATAEDVTELIRQVAERVKAQSGVTLEPEVKRLGEF